MKQVRHQWRDWLLREEAKKWGGGTGKWKLRYKYTRELPTPLAFCEKIWSTEASRGDQCLRHLRGFIGRSCCFSQQCVLEMFCEYALNAATTTKMRKSLRNTLFLRFFSVYYGSKYRWNPVSVPLRRSETQYFGGCAPRLYCVLQRIFIQRIQIQSLRSFGQLCSRPIF